MVKRWPQRGGWVLEQHQEPWGYVLVTIAPKGERWASGIMVRGAGAWHQWVFAVQKGAPVALRVVSEGVRGTWHPAMESPEGCEAWGQALVWTKSSVSVLMQWAARRYPNTIA